MKFLIASDIHGSAYYTKEVLRLFESEKADKLILLGDIYNHGPRNVLPKDYAPMQVAELLNGIKQERWELPVLTFTRKSPIYSLRTIPGIFLKMTCLRGLYRCQTLSLPRTKPFSQKKR